MNELECKNKWFNSLPIRNRSTEFDRFARACPCGETIWYDFENVAVRSWIDVHYEHREKEAAAKKPLTAEYDFARQIKFSKAGFAVFIERFGLKLYITGGGYANYSDKQERTFSFYQHYMENPVQNDHEGVYVIFDPMLSTLKNGEFDVI